MFDSIIFDLDGTLWDSTDGVCTSWNEVLKRHPEIHREPITAEDLSACMGLPMYDISAKLFPDESSETQKNFMDELCVYENEYLEIHGGRLFDGLVKTLDYLSEKYRLFIVSNCQDGYIEAFLKAHGLSGYFEDTECWGRTRLSKGESNKILIKRNGLKNPVYVGDTAGDAKSAEDAGIPFIFASYGFGNVEEGRYIHRIDSIEELCGVLQSDT